MATSHTDFIPGLTSSADYSSGAAQFTFVVGSSTTANTIVQASSQGVNVVGVLYNKPKANQAAEVACGPIVKIQLGGTLSAWTEVCCSSSGQAIAGSSTNVFVGYLLEGGVANDIVTMRLYQGHGATHS